MCGGGGGATRHLKQGALQGVGGAHKLTHVALQEKDGEGQGGGDAQEQRKSCKLLMID